MKRTAIAILAMLVAQPACADGHLWPAEPVLGNSPDPTYDLLVLKRLMTPYPQNVVARVVAIPLLGPENLIGVRVDKAGYRIIGRQAATSLKVNPNAAVSRCEVAISRPLANDILWIWNEMLLTVRNERQKPDNRNFLAVQPMTGINLTFSEQGDYGELSGVTGTNAVSKPHELVALVGSMKIYCESKDAGSLTRLERAAQTLKAHLKVKP